MFIALTNIISWIMLAVNFVVGLLYLKSCLISFSKVVLVCVFLYFLVLCPVLVVGPLYFDYSCYDLNNQEMDLLLCYFQGTFICLFLFLKGFYIRHRKLLIFIWRNWANAIYIRPCVMLYTGNCLIPNQKIAYKAPSIFQLLWYVVS